MAHADSATIRAPAATKTRQLTGNRGGPGRGGSAEEGGSATGDEPGRG